MFRKMRFVRRAGILLVLLLTLIGPRANATMPGTNGSIAYEAPGGTDGGIDHEIFVNSQFGGTTQLATNDVSDFTPAWSPDGTKIAFARRDGPSGTDEIYVMDAFGQNLVRLTKNSVDDGEPDWSPNGKRLVFSRTTSSGGIDLFAMDAKDRDHNGRGN